MDINKKSKMAIYTPNEDGFIDGTVDEVIIDFFNRHYDYNGNIDKRDLIEARDNTVKEFCVDSAFFDVLFGIIKQLYDGEYWVEEMCYDFRMETTKEDEAKEAKRPMIPKEKVWQALRRELPRKELKNMRSDDYQYEKDSYYNFDLLISAVHALKRDEITVGYFTNWCCVLMDCLMDYMDCSDNELISVFERLGWYFDGVAFTDSSLTGKKKTMLCREIIANLKYFNHEILCISSKTAKDFTTNGVITYVSFGFSVNDSANVYRICVVDTARRAINYLYAPKVDYAENINYTFLSPAEFDELSIRYHDGYSLDITMGQRYAAKVKKGI